MNEETVSIFDKHISRAQLKLKTQTSIKHSTREFKHI